MDVPLSDLRKWYEEHREEIVRDFFSFLSFPSISTDPAHAQDCRNTAKWLASYLERIGFQTVLWETPGLPVVFASYEAGPERPTVLIYHHYDVQPVDPLELWKNPPFEPEIRANKVYARGAVDNKGQCFYSLTALKALFALCKEVDINIKVFIEGEEECGGKGTTAILSEKSTAMQADYLLIVDFGIPEAHTPAITLGMRGIVTMEVECENGAIDLHSGAHGGIALNPNRALAQLLANLWDETGRIAVDHFYDEVRPIGREELSHLEMVFDAKKYESEFGVKALCFEEGYSTIEANWLRPTLEINGMWGGYTGAGFKTVIPSKAYAKLSCRLVPDQEPDVIAKRVAQHLKTQAPKGIGIKTHIHHGASGYRSSLDAQVVCTVAAAFSEVFGTSCRYQLCGASVPIVADLARASGAEVAMLGVGLDSDDIHAPNEHFGMDRFELGYLTMGRILCLLTGERR
jgi:acetylornithine deacetylase/succinyl-diaminopimelate desuccinylase-like protein